MKKLTLINLMLLIFLGASAHNFHNSEKKTIPRSIDPVKKNKKETEWLSLKYMKGNLEKTKFSGLSVFTTSEFQENIEKTRALLTNSLSIDSIDITDGIQIKKEKLIRNEHLSYQLHLGLKSSIYLPISNNNRLGEYQNLARKKVTLNYIMRSRMSQDTFRNTSGLMPNDNINVGELMFGNFYDNESPTTFREQKDIGGEDDAPDFGPKIGVSVPQIRPEEITLRNQSGTELALLDVKNAKIGFDVGFFGRVHIKKGSEFFIQSELYLSTKATEYKFENLSTLLLTTVTERYYDLNLPIHFGAKYKMKNKLYIRPQAGFVFGKRFGNENNLRTVVQSYDQSFNKVNMGWQLGLGMDIRKLRLDLRYGGDFGKYARHMSFYGNNVAFDERGKQLEISIGWSLLRLRKKK